MDGPKALSWSEGGETRPEGHRNAQLRIPSVSVSALVGSSVRNTGQGW